MTSDPERDLQRLLEEERFVRALAHRLVTQDADDVVQQTWLCAVQHGGEGVDRPRNWLARIARNIAANLTRDAKRRRARESTAAEAALVPSSAVLAEREERRRELVTAVDALPPPLRTVVLLRWFDGQPPRRIAAALGIPTATVSTQLHRALVMLRDRLDRNHRGDRRAWAVPLVSYAVRPNLPDAAPIAPEAAPLVPASVMGAIAMTTKTKLATAVVLVLAASWITWFQLDGAGTGSRVPPSAQAEPARSTVEGGVSDAPATTTPLDRERVAAETIPTVSRTGRVLVRVRYSDDQQPATGIVVRLHRSGSDPRFESSRATTDANGTALFEGTQIGRMYVDCGNRGQSIDVVAGPTTEVDFELKVGIQVTGVVVDAAQAPVAGAFVEVAPMARADSFPEVVAITGADGRFAARACPEYCLVGARAPGHAASLVKFVSGKPGNTAELRLVLGKAGGSVDGTVADANGSPVADAIVIVGTGELSGITGRDHIPPFAALARTAADGRFFATGVPVGEQSVRVRSPRFAPWEGKCEVVAGTDVAMPIVLERGGVVHGTVRSARGDAVPRCSVESGSWNDITHYRTLTAADGSFELTGLPIGQLRIRAQHDDLGKAEQQVGTSADSVAVCDLDLSRGFELIGRVVEESGQPVAEATVEIFEEGATTARWFAFTRCDSQGRFVAANCPVTGRITINVRAKDCEELRIFDVDPRTPDLEFRLRRVAPSTVRITARVVDPDGRPVANASVFAQRKDASGSSGLGATDNDGRVELGPIPPGTWIVCVHSSDYPEFTSERELAANSTWDLGLITLIHGGRARLVLPELSPPLAYFVVTGVDGRRASGSISDETGGRRTSVLAPGDYLLSVSGKGIAATAVPFSIRAGDETPVDIRPEPGVVQQFTIDVPSNMKGLGVRLAIRRSGAFVGQAWASLATTRPLTTEAWLGSGEYTVHAEANELRGSAAFTVATTPGPSVRLTLR